MHLEDGVALHAGGGAIVRADRRDDEAISSSTHETMVSRFPLRCEGCPGESCSALLAWSLGTLSLKPTTPMALWFAFSSRNSRNGALYSSRHGARM